MYKKICNSVKVLLVLVAVINISSCTKESDDSSNLSDTLFVRHKKADMPAYIHGNSTEKVFLITLHGGPGGNGLNFRNDTFKNNIEKTCAVVYFDQRGSGMSQGSYSESKVSIDIMVEDVLALVKVIKHKYGNDSRFFLMGGSWGGTLGTATLLKNQNEFLGWIELDGAHDPKGMYAEYIENFKRVATTQIEKGNSIVYWEGVQNFIKNVEPSYKEEDFFKMNSEAFKAEEKLIDDKIIANHDIEGLDSFFKYNLLTSTWNAGGIQSILTKQGLWENVSYTNRLPEITIPSLIITGEHDMIVPPKFAQEAFENLGSTEKELLVLGQSGHSPSVGDKDIFVERVLDFINEHK
ncbi:pimeloyl-ACP methyl ester carboxylesterase [Maribacter vaceletii]|uniref:Pimeloyl-ACP methyl ester carboxylesterase n=1 Tax=Maribacter vaceletii TaxID=1206816 RepID=A0A495E941_9FLAO|nr:alpha/beta hydrolase [Maribacter vaceletii]RKR13099.1 pimeloyl-ACP methyl ester carboxylesterase [Maribacter vaceletii]